MNRNMLSLLILLLAASLGTACQRDAEPPAAPAEAEKTAEAAPPATPASSSDPGAYEAFVPSGPALDHRAFAGRFSGILPCAGCPGTDTVLSLGEDYRFEFTETLQGSGAAPATVKGSWSAEEDGHRLRLDPDSKEAEDRLFQVIANDEIRLLDKDGKPIESEANLSLRRAATP